MTTIKEIKDVFFVEKYPDCYHTKHPCNHCLTVKQIDDGIFTAEIDEEINDWDRKDSYTTEWALKLERLGLKVLTRIDNSSGEAQWVGSVWILRTVHK